MFLSFYSFFFFSVSAACNITLIMSHMVWSFVGNAAEHASSIVAACKNKCDLSLGIAVGSSTQISLCVLPLLVIIGWGMDRPMTMNFEPYEAFTLVTTVMILGFAITHGTATWITGAALFIAYMIVAAGFFCHYDEPLEDHAGGRRWLLLFVGRIQLLL